MDNAKIKASGVMTFIRNSMLTVMDEGNVEAENISSVSYTHLDVYKRQM